MQGESNMARKLLKTRLREALRAYSTLPKEVRVFVEYVLPSAVLTALFDYLTELNLQNEYVMGAINIALIFLRNSKTRIQSLRK